MNKRYVNQAEFNGLVANICRDIANSGWRPDWIVGITRGGLIPAVMISQYFDTKMTALSVSFRQGEEDLETNCWLPEMAYGYGQDADGRGISRLELRKNILIVDDINDSGRTINWILGDWQTSCLPDDPVWQDVWNQNVKFATVFERSTSKAQIKIDFVGEELVGEDQPWIVFPHEEWWR